MKNKEERGGVLVCRAAEEATHHGSPKSGFPEGFDHDRRAADWGRHGAQVGKLSDLYRWLAGLPGLRSSSNLVPLLGGKKYLVFINPIHSDFGL